MNDLIFCAAFSFIIEQISNSPFQEYFYFTMHCDSCIWWKSSKNNKHLGDKFFVKLWG